MQLSDLIKNLAVGTLATILAVQLELGLGASVAMSTFGALAGTLINLAREYAPDSAYFSFRTERREFIGGGQTPLDHHYRYEGQYYIKRNYQGHSESHLAYEYNYFF